MLLFLLTVPIVWAYSDDVNAKQIAALKAETAYDIIEDPHVAAAKIWADAKAEKRQIDENARAAKSRIDEQAAVDKQRVNAETPGLVKQMWENHADQVIAAEKVIAWQAVHRPYDTSNDQML